MVFRLRSLRRSKLFIVIIIIASYYIIHSVFTKLSNSKRRGEVSLIDSIKHVAINNKQPKVNINLYDVKQANNYEFECIKTKKIFVKTTICLHDITRDVFVSKTLKETGIWEEDLVTTFMRMLNSDKNMNALDIGAQLGEYCLFAAKFSHKCLAVEPFYDSYIRLHKSALLEKTENMITLVINGISDKGGEVKRLSHVDNNIGGQSLFGDPNNYAANINDTDFKNNKYMIQTITLNDLATVVPDDFKKVIMKIDIQNYELKAFTKSDLLFSRLDIMAIFLEWDDKKNPTLFPNESEIEEFLEFMYAKKYNARHPSNLEKLERGKWKIWPYDIIWTRDDFIF